MSALCELLDSAEAAGRKRRAGEWLLVRSNYNPWAAQRIFHRSDTKFRVLVAGRGVGKTYGAAYETIQRTLAAPPGAEAGVLAPTFTHAEAAIKALCEIADPIPGVEWKQQAKRLELPGGRCIRVFSLDRIDAARGPSFVFMWLDEAALIQFRAVQASMPALRSAVHETRAIVTTTPVGKNWVWDWWTKAADGPPFERFRFSALDSPYQDQTVIEAMREGMSADYFAQEYLAEFVDNLLLVFPDRESLFVDSQPKRRPGTHCWIGIDLGKSQDWTVATLINSLGDVQIIGRWQESSPPPGCSDGKFWPAMDRHLIEICREYGAMAVVDTGGPGGAAGDVLADRLREADIPVTEVRTNQQGNKARIIEQLKADVQWRKITVLGKPTTSNPLSRQLDYEMSRFQGIKGVSRGQEYTKYEGPQIPGEFDDMVIALALANWGRARTEIDDDPLAGDLGAFLDQGDGSGGHDQGGDSWGGMGGAFRYTL